MPCAHTHSLFFSTLPPTNMEVQKGPFQENVVFLQGSVHLGRSACLGLGISGFVCAGLVPRDRLEAKQVEEPEPQSGGNRREWLRSRVLNRLVSYARPRSGEHFVVPAQQYPGLWRGSLLRSLCSSQAPVRIEDGSAARTLLELSASRTTSKARAGWGMRPGISGTGPKAARRITARPRFEAPPKPWRRPETEQRERCRERKWQAAGRLGRINSSSKGPAGSKGRDVRDPNGAESFFGFRRSRWARRARCSHSAEQRPCKDCSLFTWFKWS